MNSAQINEGSVFSVSLGGCVAHSAVYTSILHCFVVSVTEKAVQVRAYDERGKLRDATCWLPRKAFVTWQGDDRYGWRCKLAHWFKAEGYTASFLERNANHSGISAA